MRRVEEILTGYREAEAPERMDIYLGHPGLRSLFDGIERESACGSPRAQPAGGTTWLRRLCLSCCGAWRSARQRHPGCGGGTA